MNTTVAAICTPQAAGGIAMIRISGPEAAAVAEKIFLPTGRKKISEMPGHTCAYGRVAALNGETLDDGVLTVFRAPKSYTGEDVVEITCHGGLYVSRRILREIIAAGAAPAGPGEFTKRAFLNGKLSLTQAEAVADIISAEGESALSSANMIRDGALFKAVKAVSQKLVEILSALAAWTDYPDEDIPETSPEEILTSLSAAERDLKRLADGYDAGMIFREGISCAIVGRPNVGKSTLMNSLLGYERSIVTSEAGTTRDVVEERLRIGDVILKISDTAGIREAVTEAERIGVRLAERAIDRAQLILAVFDGSEELSDDDKEILKKTDGLNRIVIINKSDLPQKLYKKYFSDKYILEAAAKSGVGVEKLKDAVYEMFGLSGAGGEIFANERQKACLDSAIGHIGEAISALRAGETLDAVTVCVDSAADDLLGLSGEKVTEAVVEDVFKRFCVGK